LSTDFWFEGLFYGFGHHRIKRVCIWDLPTVQTSILFEAWKKAQTDQGVGGDVFVEAIVWNDLTYCKVAYIRTLKKGIRVFDCAHLHDFSSLRIIVYQSLLYRWFGWPVLWSRYT
jgi:hypothetical protein